MERDDLLLRLAGDAVLRHALAAASTSISRIRFSDRFEPKRAAQFFGFAAGEIGGNHGHAQQLLLKQRHTQSAFKHRFQAKDAGIRTGFPSLAPVQIRMHHLADDRAGTDDRHLHHDVIELFWAALRGRHDICARLST